MDKQKIRVAAVSYLNTQPLLYGFNNNPILEQMQLSVDYPAKIANQLINDEADIGLIPVAVIPQLAAHHIISDYCIGAEGPVASVCLFSEVPLLEIKTILLDYQSRTSIALAQLLLKEYWKINPILLPAHPGYENDIKNNIAGIIIGDRALRQRSKSKYVYDLAEAWIAHTKLPFVFAAWISNKQLPPDFIDAFNKATGAGLQPDNVEKVIAGNACNYFDLHEYYTQHISYILTPEKRKGLRHFLTLLGQEKTEMALSVVASP